MSQQFRLTHIQKQNNPSKSPFDLLNYLPGNHLRQFVWSEFSTSFFLLKNYNYFTGTAIQVRLENSRPFHGFPMNQDQPFEKANFKRSHLEEIELFLKISFLVENAGGELSLQTIADQVGSKLSTVSQNLTKLGKRCGGELLIRRPGEGIGKLTLRGKLCRKRFKSLLQVWRKLDDFARPPEERQHLPKWVSPADVRLFNRICKAFDLLQKEVEGNKRLEDVINKLPLDDHLSDEELIENDGKKKDKQATVMLALKRLEDRFGTLIDRKPKQGVKGIPIRVREIILPAFRGALTKFKQLMQWCQNPIPARLPIRMATTESLNSAILPGAVGAYLLRLRVEEIEAEHFFNEWSKIKLQLREGNYPKLIAGLRQGAYDFCIGWELAKNSCPGISQTLFLKKPVRFLLIIGAYANRRKMTFLRQELAKHFSNVKEGTALSKNQLRGILEKALLVDSDSAWFHEWFAMLVQGLTKQQQKDELFQSPDILQQKLFPLLAGQTDLLEQLFLKTEQEVTFKAVRDSLMGKSIAMVKTDYNIRSEAAVESPPNELAEAADESLIVRVKDYDDVLKSVRCGLVEAGWVPQWFLKRKFVEKRPIDGAGRNVMVYTREGEELLPQTSKLIDTLKAFVNDNTFPLQDEPGTPPASINGKLLAGETITPEEIAEWVRLKRWK